MFTLPIQALMRVRTEEDGENEDENEEEGEDKSEDDEKVSYLYCWSVSASPLYKFISR